MSEEAGREVLVLTTDSTELTAGLDAAEKRVLRFKTAVNPQTVGLDKLSSGLSAAGKEASVSGQLIAGMSKAGMEPLAASTLKANSAGDGFTSWIGLTKGLLPTLGLAAVAGGLLSFARAAMDDADALTKMHDKTGISVGGLQAMRIAGDDAGVTLESMTSAVTKLQTKLAGDDKSVNAALEDLKINVDQFKKLDGAQQMDALAKAVGQISDPLRTAKDLSALFGKSWAEQLPVLKRGFQELSDGTSQVSAASIKALDDTGDAIQRLWRKTKAAITEAVGSSIIALSNNPALTALSGKGQPGGDQKNVAMQALSGSYDGAARSAQMLNQANAGLAKQLPALGQSFKPVVVTVGELELALERNQKRTTELAQAAAELKKYRETLLDVNIVDAAHVDVVRKLIDAGPMEADVHKRVTEAVRDMVKAGQDIPPTMKAWLAAQTPVNVSIEQLHRTLNGPMHQGLIDVGQEIGVMNTGFGETARELAGAAKREQDFATIQTRVNLLLTEGARKVTAFGDRLKVGLIDTLQQVPGMMAAALTGGGGALGAAKGIGSLMGSTIGQSVGKSISSAVTGLGSLAGPIGSAIGSLVGPLIGALANIGGPNKEQRAARDEQAKFIQSLEASATMQQRLEIATVRGGHAYAVLAITGRDAMLGIGKSAADADRVVRGLLDTQNPRNFAAAMKEVEAALQLQKDAQAALNDALSRYKFTTEELGPALQHQKLSEQSQALYKDWQVLTNAGIGVAAVGREMQGSINEFVQAALKTKTEVDPAMRPMLEQMAQMGLLTDAAGTQITDLEGHGITFAMTMSEGFKAIVDEVKKLTDTIRISLGLALDTTKAKIETMPDVDVAVNYDDPGYESGPRDVQPMAKGGFGRVTRPTLFLAGEAGPEDVAFSGGGRSFGGGGGGVTVNINGGEYDTPAARLHLANKVGAAVMESIRRQKRLTA